MPSPRYAIYFVPEPDSRLSRLGQAWLGRDCWSGRTLAQPAMAGLDDLDDITAAPRRYGFHGTLKAPFRLAEGCREEDLAAHCHRFASARAAVRCPPLTVAALGAFLALVPARPYPELGRLAAEAVERFDPFRAPLSPAELARRQRAPLSERQLALLTAWGYPYVMEEFRFHMTLTGALPADRLARLEPLLESHFMSVTSDPLLIDAVALVKQADEAADFVVLERCPLGGRERRQGQPAAGQA